MAQNRNVKNYIKKMDNGASVGHFNSYILESAFQPILTVQNGKIKNWALEGLIRPSMNNEPISPLSFFASINPEDAFFVEWLCRALHLRNFSTFFGDKEFDLFINFDPSSIADDEKMSFEIQAMIRKMKDIGLSPNQITCEITENKCADAQKLVHVVQTFRSYGVRIAVDDFGAEYSDMERIAMICPDYVKYDISWLQRNMHTDTGRQEVISTQRQLNKSGIQTIFEGIETKGELDFACDMGGYAVQGYYLSKPHKVPQIYL